MDYFKSILLVVLFLPFVGCSESTSENSLDIKGNLKGIVAAIDSNGVATSRGGFKVELLGTSYSTLTDSTGLWEFKDVPTRTYIIQYSKAGYQPYKSQFFFLGGSTVWLSDNNQLLYLRQPSKMKAVLDVIEAPNFVTDSTGTHQLSGLVSGHISVNEPTPVWIGTITLFAKSQAINIADRTSYIASYLSDFRGYCFRADSTPVSINIDIPLYDGRNPTTYFGLGDSIYCRMYTFLTTIPIEGYTKGSYLYEDWGPDHFIDPETRAYIPLGTSEGSNILSTVIQ